MEIIISFLIAAIIGFVVYLICGLVDFLRPYQQPAAVLTFLIVLLLSLTGELNL